MLTRLLVQRGQIPQLPPRASQQLRAGHGQPLPGHVSAGGRLICFARKRAVKKSAAFGPIPGPGNRGFHDGRPSRALRNFARALGGEPDVVKTSALIQPPRCLVLGGFVLGKKGARPTNALAGPAEVGHDYHRASRLCCYGVMP